MLYFVITEDFADIISWSTVGILLGVVVMASVFLIRMGVLALKKAMGL